jgi:hypothetical protein
LQKAELLRKYENQDKLGFVLIPLGSYLRDDTISSQYGTTITYLSRNPHNVFKGKAKYSEQSTFQSKFNNYCSCWQSTEKSVNSLQIKYTYDGNNVIYSPGVKPCPFAVIQSKKTAALAV